MRKENKAVIVLVITTLIWGGTFPLIKVLLHRLTPMQLLTYRFFFASLVSIPFFIKGLIRDIKVIVKIALLGMLLYVAYYTQTVGLKYTTSSKSAFITGLYVVFTPILALIFVREKPTFKLMFSMFLSIVGLALLSGISVKESNINKGDMITLISAFTFAMQIVLTALYAKKLDIKFITAVQMIVMFLLSLPFSSNFLPVKTPIIIILSLAFLGIFANTLAILAETYSLKYINPNKASILFTLEPVFAGSFAFLFLHEHLTRKGIFGAILILIAMYIATRSKVKLEKSTVDVN